MVSYRLVYAFCILAGSFFVYGGRKMQTRVAVMSIIVEDTEFAEEINSILHHYAKFVIGRMGLPYRQRKISIISVAVDAPQDVISAMAGKIGRIPGVTIKTAYSNVTGEIGGTHTAE